MPVEHAHDPGAVGARLAVHEHGVLDLLKESLGAHELLARRGSTRADLKVDQLDPVARARLPLEPVAAALALAAQIDDGADTGAGEAADLVGSRLRRAPRLV